MNERLLLRPLVLAIWLAIVSIPDRSQAAVGDLYVTNADGAASEILRCTSGGASTVFAITNNPIYGLAFDSMGYLFAANAGDNTIVKFAPDGTGSLFANLGTSVPRGLAFDAAADLYVATLDNTIERFTPGGVGSVFASTGLNGPRGLAFDAGGNLYVSNLGNFTIERFTPDGVPSFFASTANGADTGLAFDRVGNLYAAGLSGTIDRITPNGVSSVFADNLIGTPYGIAFDGTGRLFVANFNEADIQQISASGVPLQFAYTFLNSQTFLAFEGVHLPVPESSTGVFLAFVVPTLVGRRHRR